MTSPALREIIALAKQIRGTDKSPGSWKRSLKLAGEQYRANHPNTRRVNKIPSVSTRIKNDPQMSALYRGFMKQLHALKLKYYNAGLTFLKVRRSGKEKNLYRNPQPITYLPPPNELMEEEDDDDPDYVDDLLTLRRKRRKPEE